VFLSKIWFVVVGIVAGVALTAAFVAPRPADRRIEQLEGQRLDRAQYAAEQMLKTDAHRWIDYVAKLGRDAVIAESLVGKGRVVARLGERENDYGEGMAGAEVISDALRGYLSDDVWGAGEKLRRIAAAPVLSKSRDKIIGVIYVGAETGKRLADVWKKNLGVEVAVLLKKQVLSSTLPEGVLADLPALLEGHKAEITEAKRTRAIPLQNGSERLLAVGAPFTGQAAEQDAYYVLIGKKAAASNPWALLSSATTEDLKPSNFPWVPLAGGLLGILVIGLFLQWREVEHPLMRLRKELRRVADGDLHKMDDTIFHGKFGGIARDVNAAIERFTHTTSTQRTDASRSDISRKDFNAILDSGPPEAVPASPFAPPPPPPSFPAPPAFSPPPPPFAAAPSVANLSPTGDVEEDARPARRPYDSEMEEEATSQLPSEEKTRTLDKPVDPEEAHFREVFADYVNARRQTGEPTASLTLDKFRAKLQANRQQLIAKYNCKTARFSVYIKDGKAAIKATPVRE
jgi:hypothetical protein